MADWDAVTQEVRLTESSTAKVRRPWHVGALAVVTAGIYGLFWYYRVNRELRDLGRVEGRPDLQVDPRLATLAVALPYVTAVAWAFSDRSTPVNVLGGIASIPAIVSWYRTLGRVRGAEAQERLGDRLNIPLALPLVLLSEAPYGFLFPSVEAFQTAVFAVGILAFSLLCRYVQSHLNAVWRTLAVDS